MVAVTAARLFNCQPDNAAPDWSAYATLQLGGCIDHDGETEGLVSHDKADFFTVYGIDADGIADAITDTPTTATLANARTLAGDLSALSGLPVRDCRFLASGDA